MLNEYISDASATAATRSHKSFTVVYVYLSLAMVTWQNDSLIIHS